MTDPMRTDFVDVPGNPAPKGAEVVWFEGSAGRNLRACLVPATASDVRGTVIVCPGRTEFIEKYFEVGRELQAKGFAVLILDWPGQGLSERLLEDREKGHIDRFETFMGALRNGLDAFSDRLPRPHVSLAHSMGGAIALAAIAQDLVRVEAAAFCAPMWGLPINRMTRYLIWAMRVLGRSGDYAQQPGPPERFDTNIVTHDKGRWDIQRALTDASPDLLLGPVTWGWLGASLDILRDTTRPALLRKVDIPVLVVSAGQEKLVDNRIHEKAGKYIPDYTHITVDGAYHEVLMETDARRKVFWDAFDGLLDKAGI